MPQSKPNIVLILADEHRADCLGAYGNEDIKTPNLDELATDGVVFDQAFCSSPLCAPSRYSILTGLYPHQHLGWDNRSSIPSHLPTFARSLQHNGYRTQAIGKMHLTPTYLDVGFDEMQLAEQNGLGRFEDDYHRELRTNNWIDKLDLMDQVDEFRKDAPEWYWDAFGAVESDLPEQVHSTSWIGRKALESVEKWQDNGNLMVLSFVKPHHPFDPPKPWSQMYDPSQLRLLPGWTDTLSDVDRNFHPGFFPHQSLTETSLRQVMAMYYATISHVDFYVGELIRLLKQRRMYDNTLIIYSSDHGEYMGFHHLLLKENHMYDPVVRIPLIIKPIGGTVPPVDGSQLVSNVDLANTILGQAGLEPIMESAGMDLMAPHASREFVVSEELNGRQYMVRTVRLKLILQRDASKNMLFDLQSDPSERHNVYKDPRYGDDVRRLTDALHHYYLFECSSNPYHVPQKASSIQGEISENLHWIRQQMRKNVPDGKNL